jgi:hypothetical protein
MRRAQDDGGLAVLERELADIDNASAKSGKTGYALHRENQMQQRSVSSSGSDIKAAREIIDNCIC